LKNRRTDGAEDGRIRTAG